LWDRKDQQRCEFLTLNISEWPNDAAVCSLSQVLETGSIPQKFFLSSKACAGILRRAESRGKKLPPQLQHALESVAIITNRQRSDEYGTDDVASTMSARDYKAATDLAAQPTMIHGTQDPIISDIAFPPGRNSGQENVLVQAIALAENTIGRKPENGGNGDGFREGGPMYTLNATGVHGVAIGTDCYNGTITGDISMTLKCGDGNPAINQPTVMQAITQFGEIAGTLSARHDSSPCADRGQNMVNQSMAVRRLTPVECERLQGFPDNYTNIPKAADGPRYKALGNSMAVPVMAWIGKRIAREVAA
jgi:DNA (cytosine-5)-methyltransferase 1